MQHRTLWAFVSVLALTVAIACGGGETDAPVTAEPSAPAAAPIDPATTGNITGTITLEGTPPEPELIRMNSDPVCVRESSDPQTGYYIVSESGGLGNVFVYVKEGLEGRTFPPPSGTVRLEQDGCRYIPHVFGIRVGQTLEVINSDPTLHNIHATPAANPEFNTGQPVEGMVYERVFESPEVMIPFKCDVHGWMNAYSGVLEHPFFSVTSDDGTFDLAGLPPGDYVIEAWHEMLGTQTTNVTLGETATEELSLTFTVG